VPAWGTGVVGRVHPFIDFYLIYHPLGAVDDVKIACSGGGAGTFSFDLIHPWNTDAGTDPSGYHGTYSFECPDAGMSVSGCFRYLVP
jgi:hypothetical protein